MLTLYTRSSDVFYLILEYMDLRSLLLLSSTNRIMRDLIYRGVYRNIWLRLWKRDISEFVLPLGTAETHCYDYGQAILAAKSERCVWIAARNGYEKLLHPTSDGKGLSYKAQLAYPYHYYDNIFYEACAGGHLHIVKAMSIQGIEFWDDDHLYISALNGHLDVVEYLLSRAPLEVSSDEIFLICETGRDDILRLLIESGSCLRQLSRYSLVRITLNGHHKMIRYLASLGYSTEYTLQEGLLLAIDQNDLDLIQSRVGNPQLQLTPAIIRSIGRNSLPIMRILTKELKVTETNLSDILVFLQVAIPSGYRDITNHLLSLIPSRLKSKFREGVHKCLVIAAQNGYLEIFTDLLKWYPKATIDDQIVTAAMHNFHFNILRYILSLGVTTSLLLQIVQAAQQYHKYNADAEWICNFR